LQYLKKIKYPVLVATIFLFILVALSTRDSLVGIFIVFIVLPIILFCQIIARWLLKRRLSVKLRRSIMLFPALVIAISIFHNTNDFGGRQKAAVKTALAGQLPSNIHDLHVHEDAWTDYVVYAYFKCDPKDIQNILESPPFEREKSNLPFFSFDNTPFPELKGFPPIKNVIQFHRNDLEEVNGICLVYTDSNFSFIYVLYGVD